MDKRTQTSRELTAIKKRKAAAAAIVKALYTDAWGREVDRLVQELPDKTESGGYCREALEKLIIKHLAVIGLQ